jgi:LysM repeat protein
MVKAEARRLAGPVALLAAATVVALGARALLHDEARSASKPPPPPAATPRRSPPPPARPPAPAPPPAPATREVVVEAGDTLGGLAAAHGTTVEELLLLNPGVDPAALRVGQRIRVPAADG